MQKIQGMLIAWFDELGRTAETLEGEFTSDQAQYQWRRGSEKIFYSQSRPSLLRLLGDVEQLEVEQGKRRESELRKQGYWLYSASVGHRFHQSERAELEEERNAALLELRHMERALIKVNGTVIVSPTRVAYLRIPIIAKDRRDKIVCFADSLGVQQIIAQIARDQRRLQVVIDLDLNGPGYASDPLMIPFWSVRTDQDLRALLDGKTPQHDVARLDGTIWKPLI